MAIPFYLCQAHGGSIIQMDDPSVFKDLTAAAGTGGNSYTAELVSSPVVAAGVGGYGRLRRFHQRIEHDNIVTVNVTGYRDGHESGPTVLRPMLADDSPVVEVPLALDGSEFQIKIALSTVDAWTALGSAAFWVVPKKSTRLDAAWSQGAGGG